MNKLFQSLQLTLLNVGFASLNEKWNYDNVISPFSRLYYITDGQAKVYHNDQVFELKKDHIYLIPSHTYSRYTCDAFMEQYYASFLEEMGNGVSIYHLKSFVYELPATELDLKLFERLLEINPQRTIVRDDPKFYDNQQGLMKFLKSNERLSVSNYIETKGILMSFLSRFIQNKQAPIQNPINDTRLSKVVRYIREHLHETLTIEELAQECHLNPDYFSRLFYEEIGMRPINYINKQRIERAKLLLISTSDSLTEIADKIGMNNLSYFSRLFKQHVGQTPSEFRKQEWQLT